MKSGIYKITNLASGKLYIGSSSDLMKRKTEHFRLLRLKKHCNKHLQSAFNKYGESNFIFEIVLYCDLEKLIAEEQRFIDFYEAYKNGYNLCPIANTTAGRAVSEERRKKISQSLKGRVSPMKGRKHSEETKQKISLSEKGKKVSKESKKKMSLAKKGTLPAMTGKKHSLESRQKMSASHKKYQRELRIKNASRLLINQL